jgi:hypothetical protein
MEADRRFAHGAFPRARTMMPVTTDRRAPTHAVKWC